MNWDRYIIAGLEAFLEGRKWKGVLVNSKVGHDTERKSVNSFMRGDIIRPLTPGVESKSPIFSERIKIEISEKVESPKSKREGQFGQRDLRHGRFDDRRTPRSGKQNDRTSPRKPRGVPMQRGRKRKLGKE
jgi:hypothetical protein